MKGAYNTYIWFKIGDTVFDYDDTEHAVSINTVRNVYDSCLDFVIEVYDSTAFDVESCLLDRSVEDHKIEFEYGYSEIEERRTPRYLGVVTKVTPRFDITGETLTLEGKAWTEYKSIMSNDQKTYYDTPSEAVRQIAAEEGWTIMAIVGTKKPEPDGYSPDNTRWSIVREPSLSAREFIDQYLIPISITEGGKGDYRLLLEPLENETLMWYIPAEYEYLTDYNITVGSPEFDEVISFTPNYNYLAPLMGSGGVTMEYIDTISNEQGTVSVGDSNTMGSKQIKMSSKYGNQNNVTIEATNIFQHSANNAYPADLVLVGDPTIKAGHYINVQVLTAKGQLHPTTGRYMIMTVEDLIDGGSFTSTLSMRKIGQVNTVATASTDSGFYAGTFIGGGTGSRYASNISNDSTVSALSAGLLSTYVEGEELGDFLVTAYCPCSICCGQYSYEVTGVMNKTGLTGDVPSEGRTIAVDPSVIPEGSWVIWDDPKLGKTIRRAEDKGGAIKGNRIDLYFGDHQSAKNYGSQKVKVYIANINPAINSADIKVPEAVQGSLAAAVACKYLGTPYVWGGKNIAEDGGLDCSGFAVQVVKEMGGSAWGNVASLKSEGMEVSGVENAQPGDLMINPSQTHVVVYLGNGYVIHSPKPGDVVKISKLYFTPSTIRRFV